MCDSSQGQSFQTIVPGLLLSLQENWVQPAASFRSCTSCFMSCTVCCKSCKIYCKGPKVVKTIIHPPGPSAGAEQHCTWLLMLLPRLMWQIWGSKGLRRCQGSGFTGQLPPLNSQVSVRGHLYMLSWHTKQGNGWKVNNMLLQRRCWANCKVSYTKLASETPSWQSSPGDTMWEDVGESTYWANTGSSPPFCSAPACVSIKASPQRWLRWEYKSHQPHATRLVAAPARPECVTLDCCYCWLV